MALPDMLQEVAASMHLEASASAALDVRDLKRRAACKVEEASACLREARRIENGRAARVELPPCPSRDEWPSL